MSVLLFHFGIFIFFATEHSFVVVLGQTPTPKLSWHLVSVAWGGVNAGCGFAG